MEGKVEMLKLIHFPTKAKPKAKADFNERFKEFVKEHNARIKGKRK